MADNIKNQRLAVVGAGPTGSTLAITLAQRGYNVDLFEKRPDPTGDWKEEGRSFNLSVSVRALNGFKHAGVEDEITKIMVPLYKRCVHMPDNSIHFYPYGKETDCVLSIKRKNIMNILTKRIKQLPNITHHFNTTVKNVNLEETKFDTVNADGSLTTRKYDFVFGTDGAFSAVQRSFLQTLDFNFSVEFGEYGYIELDIPVDEHGNNRTHDQVFHFWPRKGVMMAGFPNPEQNHTIGLFMKTKGENSFESFGGNAEKFE